MTPKKSRFNPTRFDHFTETHPAVIEYLSGILGGAPTINNDAGADLIAPDGATIEVKSTREWNRTKHANGKRRRGRFTFNGYENAEYLLLVLIRSDDSFEFFFESFAVFIAKYGIAGSPTARFDVNWRTFFASAKRVYPTTRRAARTPSHAGQGRIDK